MGLHRVHGAQDFGKSSLTLDIVEFGQWERTWEACHIVAQRFVFFQTCPWELDALYAVSLWLWHR